MALFTTDTAAKARSRFFDYKTAGRDQCRLRPLNITMRNSQASAKEKRTGSRPWSPSDYGTGTDRGGTFGKESSVCCATNGWARNYIVVHKNMVRPISRPYRSLFESGACLPFLLMVSFYIR